MFFTVDYLDELLLLLQQYRQKMAACTNGRYSMMEGTYVYELKPGKKEEFKQAQKRVVALRKTLYCIVKKDTAYVVQQYMIQPTSIQERREAAVDELQELLFVLNNCLFDMMRGMLEKAEVNWNTHSAVLEDISCRLEFLRKPTV